MKKQKSLFKFLMTLQLLLLLLVLSFNCVAKEYVIYSISQDIPMGFENEIIKKNFYVNIGKKQGISKGTILDAFRVISRSDPYKSKKRYIHKVKIGELQVLHSEDGSSIAKLSKLNLDENFPLFEISGFMIGDRVNVHVSD